jgi:hypothetical protein
MRMAFYLLPALNLLIPAGLSQMKETTTEELPWLRFINLIIKQLKSITTQINQSRRKLQAIRDT